MTAPELIWLDQGFQPWRVWRLRMDGLTSYTRTDTIQSDPRVKALVEALEEIARQKKTTEFAYEVFRHEAEFEGGYDQCVTTARTALASLKGAANE